MPGGRDRLAGGKKKLWSYGVWRISQNSLEHPALVLRRAGRRVEIG